MKVTYKYYTGELEKKKEHVYTGELLKLERISGSAPQACFGICYNLILRLDDGAEVKFNCVELKDLMFLGGATKF